MRIASFQTAAHALVIPALGPLEARHPDLQCELVQAEAENALPALRLGDVDMVLAEEYDHAPRPRDPALEQRELCRDALVFAVPDGHPAAAQETIAFADLRDDEWAGGEAGTAWNDMIERACRSLGGYEPDVRHNVDDVRLILSLVAGRGAVGLVPALGLHNEIEGFVWRPPAEGPLERRIFTAVRRGTADAAGAAGRARRARRAGARARAGDRRPDRLVALVRVGLELVLVLDDLVVGVGPGADAAGLEAPSTSSSRLCSSTAGSSPSRTHSRSSSSSTRPVSIAVESSTTITTSVVGL